MAKVWSKSLDFNPIVGHRFKEYCDLGLGLPIHTRKLQPRCLVGRTYESSSFNQSVMHTSSVTRSEALALKRSALSGGKSSANLYAAFSRRQQKHENLSRRTAFASFSATGSGSMEIATTLFTFATTLVIPIYTVMILAPHWEWTRKLVESSIPYIVLGGLYVYLLHGSWTSETLHLIFATKHYLPELSGITKMFASTLTVASAWVHLLAGDLFIGRHIFLDGLDHNVETRHSLLLCMIVCPIGLLSHMLTKVTHEFLFLLQVLCVIQVTLEVLKILSAS